MLIFVNHGGGALFKAETIGTIAAQCVIEGKRCLFVLDACESTQFAAAAQQAALKRLEEDRRGNLDTFAAFITSAPKDCSSSAAIMSENPELVHLMDRGAEAAHLPNPTLSRQLISLWAYRYGELARKSIAELPGLMNWRNAQSAEDINCARFVAAFAGDPAGLGAAKIEAFLPSHWKKSTERIPWLTGVAGFDGVTYGEIIPEGGLGGFFDDVRSQTRFYHPYIEIQSVDGTLQDVVPGGRANGPHHVRVNGSAEGESTPRGPPLVPWDVLQWGFQRKVREMGWTLMNPDAVQLDRIMEMDRFLEELNHDITPLSVSCFVHRVAAFRRDLRDDSVFFPALRELHADLQTIDTSEEY
jgi:hypothetical protein